MLRRIELFCDYIRRALHLADVDTLFADIKPFLSKASNESILVRAMSSFVKERLFGGVNPSITEKLAAEAAQKSLVQQDRTIFMDGETFIAIVDSCICVSRPDEVIMFADVPHGWQIRLSRYDGTTWTSSYFEFGAQSVLSLRHCFAPLMDRLAQNNAPIHISNAERQLQDY